MREHNIFITYEAIYDIADAEEYIEYTFGPERAKAYHDAIYAEILSLSGNATMYGTTGLKYRKYTIYKKPFRPAIIFWIIKEDGVHVLRVTREEYNWQKFFRTHKNYEFTYPETDFIP